MMYRKAMQVSHCNPARAHLAGFKRCASLVPQTVFSNGQLLTPFERSSTFERKLFMKVSDSFCKNIQTLIALENDRFKSLTLL